MRTKKILLAALTIIASSALFARPVLALVEPWHNPNLAFDVDNNGLVQPRDVLLIINRLENPLIAMPALGTPPGVDLTSTFYWDTNNDGRVSPLDALVVIDDILTTPARTPEPSSIVLAGMGLFVLAGYAWRRRRRAV
jgi:MYXO-CTERM domain-containing protein